MNDSFYVKFDEENMFLYAVGDGMLKPVTAASSAAVTTASAAVPSTAAAAFTDLRVVDPGLDGFLLFRIAECKLHRGSFQHVPGRELPGPG